MVVKELKNITFMYLDDTKQLVIRDNFENEVYVNSQNIISLVRFILRVVKLRIKK